MSEPFINLDLHNMTKDEAIEEIDEAIASADQGTYHLRLIHGFNRGTSLRTMIYDWYKYDTRVKRIMPGDNPGITILVLRELY